MIKEAFISVVLAGALVMNTTAAEIMKGVRTINFAGDSLTDGSAWTDWVIETLRANGHPDVVKQDAGVAGDNVAKLKARFHHDVLDRKPDLVVLNIGTNDRGPVEEYQREVGELVKQVRQSGAKLLLLIPPGINDPKDPTRDARVVAYGEALRALAKEHKCELVDLHSKFAGGVRSASADEQTAVSQRQVSPEDAAKYAKILWGPDGVHHTKNGWRTMGRAVLDALGCAAPMIEKVSVERGMLTEWFVSPPVPWNSKMPLPPAPEFPETFDPILSGWRKFDREAEAAQTSWWQESWVQRGGIMPMGQSVVTNRPGAASGTSAAFSMAFLKADAPKKVTLHLGGSPGCVVWLNGDLVWECKTLRGYHPDAERFEVNLRKGQNRLVVFSNWLFYVALSE